ncbi:MAG TPA: glycerol-3-phosphate dehydrogenase/oxidase, partial [Candidatus Polarisedimenticolaceae bacterium]|nr:glycerol-3-phosphate dehydrogenase/oxidase [Candidatus Polarisedimenticolaceae bacterium]
MKREFARLGAGAFDLVVVGGGIYGAWTAYDAALRGLRVALVEQRDWAAGTSSASSKLIHGGLRYLEQLRFGLVRQGLNERARLLRLGPHRVRPLRFVLPVYAGDRVGLRRLQLGLWLYDRLGGGALERPATLAPGELRRRCAFVRGEGLQAGLTFGDAQTDDARFTLEIVDGACAAGAVAVNRARAELVAREGAIAGVIVHDLESDQRTELRARAVVCCAGPWTDELLRGVVPEGALRTRYSKGVHLALPALAGDAALLVMPRADRRVVFLLPWYGRTLVGTTDTDYAGRPEDARAEPADVAYLLGEANRVLGGAGWSAADVQASFAGVRTLPRTGATRPSEVSRELVLSEPLRG